MLRVRGARCQDTRSLLFGPQTPGNTASKNSTFVTLTLSKLEDTVALVQPGAGTGLAKRRGVYRLDTRS